jgi:hypothetical protein
MLEIPKIRERLKKAQIGLKDTFGKAYGHFIPLRFIRKDERLLAIST